MKFKDFQALVLFSSTFKALNLGEKFQYFQGCVGTMEMSTINTDVNYSAHIIIMMMTIEIRV